MTEAELEKLRNAPPTAADKAFMGAMQFDNHAVLQSLVAVVAHLCTGHRDIALEEMKALLEQSSIRKVSATALWTASTGINPKDLPCASDN